MGSGKDIWSLIRRMADYRGVEPFKVFVFMPGEIGVSGELQDIGYEYADANEFNRQIVERTHEGPDTCGVCGDEIKSRYKDLVIHLANHHGMYILPDEVNLDMKKKVSK